MLWRLNEAASAPDATRALQIAIIEPARLHLAVLSYISWRRPVAALLAYLISIEAKGISEEFRPALGMIA